MNAEATVKKVVVFKEKHDTIYYDASSEELLGKALLSILRLRMKEGYWYPEPKLRDLSEYKDYLEMPEETIALLPESMKKEIEKAKRIERNVRAEYDEEVEWYEAAQHVLSLPESEAIALKRGHQSLLLWLFIQRQDYQYEGWDIITLDVA
jgi:hypothetical protein